VQRSDLSEEQRKVLAVLERTFNCYITEDPAASSLKEKLNEAEAKLAAARNTMQLGYTDPESGKVAAAAAAVHAVNLLVLGERSRLRR
jgi:hypothetical protein